jgi:hypothetical protein
VKSFVAGSAQTMNAINWKCKVSFSLLHDFMRSLHKVHIMNALRARSLPTKNTLRTQCSQPKGSAKYSSLMVICDGETRNANRILVECNLEK